ncbi:MAG: hypothetical protein KTR35_08280 [Gammaproteobacteria bacterium]|nr:hypothetical protein [Gammaproteobacteria bacterium]
MGISLNDDFSGSGIWVNLYPVGPFGDGKTQSESVCLSSVPQLMGVGPSDDELVVINSAHKRPFAEHEPPIIRGELAEPFVPRTEADLQFVDEGTEHFCCVHMFGSVRRALDVWETYFGYKLTGRRQKKIQLIPFVDWNNAQAGDRFIETGFQVSDEGITQPFCLSFDILAHECAHIILFEQIGTPTARTVTSTYKAFHEAAADWMSLLSVLHFDGFLERVLDATQGNLYQPNQWSQFGQISPTSYIRLASNAKRMSQVASPNVPLADLGPRELHEMAEPLIGALYDIYVGIYQAVLQDMDVPIPTPVGRSKAVSDEAARMPCLETQNIYRLHRDEFIEAMKTSRDLLGFMLAESCLQLPAHFMDFQSITDALFVSDELITGGRYQEVIMEALTWREILYH